MELELMELQRRAEADAQLRRELFETKNSPEPIKAFCDKCNELGYGKITPYALATAGEEFCAAMLRSVNGGGVDAPDGWDDFYEMFFSALEEMEKHGK